MNALWLQLFGFIRMSPGLQIPPISLNNSLFAGNLAGDGRGYYCVASQTARRLGRLPKRRESGPEIRALFAHSLSPPDSPSAEVEVQIPERL